MPAALTVAGRTDTGVHAWGQVASLELKEPPATDLRRALDAVTPREIAVYAATEAAPGFNARRDARSRTYCYRLLPSARRQPV